MGVYALLAIFALGRFLCVAQTARASSGTRQTQNGRIRLSLSLATTGPRIRPFGSIRRRTVKRTRIKIKRPGTRNKRREQEQTPTPGSIAAHDREKSSQRSGPQVVDGDNAEEPVQEYSGPAVLSRSYSVNRPLIPEQLKWRESVGVSSVYDTGITGK